MPRHARWVIEPPQGSSRAPEAASSHACRRHRPHSPTLRPWRDPQGRLALQPSKTHTAPAPSSRASVAAPPRLHPLLPGIGATRRSSTTFLVGKGVVRFRRNAGGRIVCRGAPSTPVHQGFAFPAWTKTSPLLLASPARSHDFDGGAG